MQHGVRSGSKVSVGVAGSMLRGGGRSVQQLVSKGAGAMQQLMGTSSPLATPPDSRRSTEEVLAECLSSLTAAAAQCAEADKPPQVKLVCHPFYCPAPGSSSKVSKSILTASVCF